jgi:putative endonuclease
MAELVDLPAGRQARKNIRMIYKVYAIKSLNKNYIYVGLTSDLEKRIMRHNSGHERTTRAYAPFKIIHQESCDSRQAARTREKYLKSGIGKGYLKALI